MREPDKAAKAKAHPELTSHVVIIKGFVIPISISEHNGAHVICRVLDINTTINNKLGINFYRDIMR